MFSLSPIRFKQRVHEAMATQGLRNRAEEFLASLVFQLQLIRLRVERAVGTMLGRGARNRVLATACWSFPIYSQTFVYQELTQMIRRGFKVRFIYSKLDRGQPMPSQFSRLWRAKRRLILHPSVCEDSYAYFLKRMPAKIDALVDMLSRASGMTPQEVQSQYHFLQAFSFARMVQAYRPHYLHSYFFYEGTFFALVASCLLDIPRGVSCYADHMLEDYALKTVPLHNTQCSLVVATSERIKRELMGIAPQASPDRIIVKPNAINAAQFPAEDRLEPENGQPYRLVSVSRIEPKKGLVYLVEAVRYLRDRRINVEAHLIGGIDDSASSKDYARELDSRIKELGLSDIVHLEGRRSESEIKRFFSASHLFVAPFVETESGDKDGIPTSLLEGMSSGLPVVATDAGSITEVIEDGQQGVLVPQRDPAALGNAIETLFRDSDRRRRLGQEAADSIRRRFDVGVCEGIFHERVRTVIDGYHPNVEASYDGRSLNDSTASRRELSHEASPPESQTKVTVIITTFNHERFINEAIDSVLMQETNFDYDIVIIEDCSSDRTRDIVIEYQKVHPQKMRLVLSETNKCDNSEFMQAILSSSSPYVAILDGHDYWTSRQKLQKQVDYLDRHPECAICFHDVKILYEDGSEETRNSNAPSQQEISTLEDLIEGCFIQTCSTMYRRGALSEIPSWYTSDQSADWSLLILAAQHGKIGYLNDVMGVYRQHSRGFWTGLRKSEQLERVIQFYEALRGHVATQYFGRIERARARHRHDLALENGNRPLVSDSLRESERMLRVTGGSVADLVFPPDDPDTVRIAIEKAATKTVFDIQLNQPHLKVRANNSYTIRFRARADYARSIAVGFAEAHEPWAGLGLYKGVELTREWQSFEEEFVAAADEENARIHFDLGGSDIPVELTAVSLRHLPDRRPIEPDVQPVQIGNSQSNGARLDRLAEDQQRPAEERAPIFRETQFGKLRRVTPVSRNWGFDRGQPVDRYYIENFLAEQADAIRGRLLEIGDDSYTRRFGGARVTRSDVLHVVEGNPQATIVADLTCAPQIPSATFDCIVLTQTLQLIYDVRAAIQTLYRILKPGGVLLATFPGISQTSDPDWGNDWYWNFTTLSARRLFEEFFSAADVKVEAFGNVLAATSFLHGLAAEELTREELDYHDPGYDVTITVRASKPDALA